MASSTNDKSMTTQLYDLCNLQAVYTHASLVSLFLASIYDVLYGGIARLCVQA